jgi:hypothetical protein
MKVFTRITLYPLLAETVYRTEGGESGMEELSLHEVFSRPAGNTCVRCGGFAVAFRDTSSKLEYMVSALCQECQDQCYSMSNKRR